MPTDLIDFRGGDDHRLQSFYLFERYIRNKNLIDLPGQMPVDGFFQYQEKYPNAKPAGAFGKNRLTFLSDLSKNIHNKAAEAV